MKGRYHPRDLFQTFLHDVCRIHISDILHRRLRMSKSDFLDLLEKTKMQKPDNHNEHFIQRH
jgi:hypothetical protein